VRCKELEDFQKFHREGMAAMEAALEPDLFDTMMRLCPSSSYPPDWIVAGIQYLRVRVAELERACASGARASRRSAAPR